MTDKDKLASMQESLLEQIAETYLTPTYVYDLDHVKNQLEGLKVALPEAAVYYAVKANPCGAVLKHLSEQGVGAEVISLGELERAHKAGISSDFIVLGGPRQDLALMERALKLGVKLVSLDSVSQWELWNSLETDTQFLLRVNPALDPQTHEHLATGAASSKFGMTISEALELAEELEDKGQLRGFHVHAGSQIKATEVYDEILETLRSFYKTYEQCDLLDIGGGYGVPGFDIDGFAPRLRAFAAEFELKIMLEPGRFLVADAGVLLSRVLHTKSGGLNHIIADAGMAELLRPALYNAEHPIKVIGKSGKDSTVDIDGPLCENADRLGRARPLPEVTAGDLLIIEQAGAYGFAMSSNYASSLRPAEVVVTNGKATLARQRETVDDLVRLERV